MNIQPRENAENWKTAPDILALSDDIRDGIGTKLADLSARLSASDAEFSRLAADTRMSFSPDQTFRLLIVVEPDENPVEIIHAAAEAFKANTESWWGTKQLFYGESTCPGKLAFAFPGQGSQYLFMGQELAGYFQELALTLSSAEKFFNHEQPLADYMYPSLLGKDNEKKQLEEQLRATDIAQPAIGAVSAGMQKILHRFGISPDGTCGHSYGELSALHAGGRFDDATFFALSAARGKYMRDAGGTGDAGSMLAVKAPLETIDQLIANHSEVILANRNSPDQGVLSGPTDAIEAMKSICKENKIRAVVLPVSAAFHSQLVAAAAEPFEKKIAAAEFLPSSIPVYSNTTGLPYPDDPTEAKKILARHLMNPVNFIEEIKNMYQDGMRIFVEVGPRAVLTGLIKAILKDQPAHIIAMDASSGRRPAIRDLAKTLCTLASLGYPVVLKRWKLP